MNANEMKDASVALMRWFQSQGIAPRNACGVMAMTIGSVIAFHHEGAMPEIKRDLATLDEIQSITCLQAISAMRRGVC